MPSPLQSFRQVIRDGRDRIHQAGEDIKAVAGEMKGMAGVAGETTPPDAVAPEEPSPGEQPTSTPSRSALTSDETLAYQNREIAKELWALEKHLAQGCRIPDSQGTPVPCDCCEKGTFIAGLAQEAIPIAERSGKLSGIYEKIARWCEETEPMVTVAAVKSGQHDYKKLSGQASALRKELMGTTALKAMLRPGSAEQ